MFQSKQYQTAFDVVAAKQTRTHIRDDANIAVSGSRDRDNDIYKGKFASAPPHTHTSFRLRDRHVLTSYLKVGLPLVGNGRVK